MAKRFKFKISKILSFRSCRSKDPSSLPADPVPSFLPPSDPINPTPTKQPRRSSFKCCVSSAFGCGMGRPRRSFPPCLSDAAHTEPEPSPPPTPRFHWESEGKWHVFAKIDKLEDGTSRRKIYATAGLSNDDVLAHSGRENLKRQRMKKKMARRARVSGSSADDSVFTGESFENDDNGEETESLIPPSGGLSAENSPSDLRTIPEMPRVIARRRRRRKINDQSIKAPKRCVPKRNNAASSAAAESDPSPARPSTFVERFVPCAAAVAVEKRSEDPYEDFKGSMMEMIMEKKMFEAAELERLLRCFLTLNSRRHHATIVTAFSEIWEALFAGGTGGRRSSGVHRLHFE